MRLPRGTREAALAVAAALAVLLSLQIKPVDAAWRRLETGSLDLRFRMRGVLPPPPDIALVMVDDASLARLGRWPFSRHLLARAVDRLSAAGAKLIVFDQLFIEPERPKPADLRDLARRAGEQLGSAAPDDLRQAMKRLADDDPDGDFADAIRRSGRVLLPFAFTFEAKPDKADAVDLSDAGYQQFGRSSARPADTLDPTGAIAPIPPLREAAAGLGDVSIHYDRDNAPRYEYLAVPFDGDYLPPISVRAAAAALDVPWDKVELTLGEGLRIGARVVPTDRYGRLLVDYLGPRATFPTRSFADLLDGQIPNDEVAGRIVILGASFTGNQDANPAPFGKDMLPGSERMATVIADMVRGDFITELPIRSTVVVPLALLIGIAGGRLPTRSLAPALALPTVGWFAAARIAFGYGLWLPVAVPAGALLLAAAVATLFRVWVTDRERRRIKSTFSRYMPATLVEFLAAHPDRVKLGGETRRITLMFSDIRGFTTISEAFADDPQGLVRLVNRFLTRMADIIHDHDGTIDKYIGDCIMAYWNAPLDDPRHADLACAAALAMRDALVVLNAELEIEAAAENRVHHPLNAGVGINTGDCVLGNLGSARTVQSFSALGDPVNLASRLEGQSKLYGVDIVIGEATRRSAPDWAALELDLIAVKGKREAARIFALLGGPERAATGDFRTLLDRHATMLAAYRAQTWADARAALEECLALAPDLAKLYALFRDRIDDYAADPPGADWDGVYVATTK